MDLEYGFSCMGYEVAGPWGASIAPTYALLVFIVCYGASGVLLWLIPGPQRGGAKAREILTIQP